MLSSETWERSGDFDGLSRYQRKSASWKHCHRALRVIDFKAAGRKQQEATSLSDSLIFPDSLQMKAAYAHVNRLQTNNATGNNGFKVAARMQRPTCSQPRRCHGLAQHVLAEVNRTTYLDSWIPSMQVILCVADTMRSGSERPSKHQNPPPKPNVLVTFIIRP